METAELKVRDAGFLTPGDIDKKVVLSNELGIIREKYRDKKIVLCHGTYDILHPGHLLHLEDAKKQGDILVVTITGDKHILKKKKTFFNEELRAKQVASVEIVDYVSIIHEPTALTSIENLKPDFYIKGGEYKDLVSDPTSNIIREKDLVEKHGGEIFFTNGQTFSSTKIGHFLGVMSEARENKEPYGKSLYPKFRDISDENFNIVDINNFITKASKLKVALIGETIVDEWKYIELRSVSQKSKCISGEEQNSVRQIGGTGIIALHLANFVGQVDYYTNEIDDKYSHENLNIIPIAKGNISKTRFVDNERNNIVYENKIIDPLESDLSILPNLEEYDLVMVSDFGHGLLDAVQAQRLAKTNSRFFAVQVQSNSSNFGFNLVSKYPFADYYSLNKLEAELLLHKRYSDYKEIVNNLSEVLRSKQFALTLSQNGAVIKNFDTEAQLPALSQTIVDTIGCGDAFFTYSSLAIKLGFDARHAVLFGNVGSAIMSQKICNETPVTRNEFQTVCKIVI